MNESLRQAGPTPAGMAQRCQQRTKEGTGPVWLLATSEDFRWPATEVGSEMD